MDDAELVRRALEDPDDFGPIVERYEKPLMRFMHRLSQLSAEDAEDLAQRVFLKAYDHLNDFDPKLKLSTWLLRIARHEVIDFWRRKQARPQEYELDETRLDETHGKEPTMAHALDQKLKSERVRQLLALLQPEHRAVLILYYFEEKNYEEIADILECPPGTVAALLSRAKKAFAKLAGRTGDADHLTLFHD